MILISLFIQINSTDNEMSIKKFVYLMIDDFKRQNKHQEINRINEIKIIELLENLLLIKYTLIHSINRIKEIKIFDCLRITKNSFSNQTIFFFED